MMKSKAAGFLVGGLLLLGAAPGLARAAGGQEGPVEKYAPILGDYEFDLSDQGMGVIVIKIYVEGDIVYGWPETSSEPAVMEPVEGEVFMFRIHDPDEGDYEATFLKDETGKYARCRLVNEAMGMDVEGERVQKRPVGSR